MDQSTQLSFFDSGDNIELPKDTSSGLGQEIEYEELKTNLIIQIGELETVDQVSTWFRYQILNEALNELDSVWKIRSLGVIYHFPVMIIGVSIHHLMEMYSISEIHAWRVIFVDTIAASLRNILIKRIEIQSKYPDSLIHFKKITDLYTVAAIVDSWHGIKEEFPPTLFANLRGFAVKLLNSHLEFINENNSQTMVVWGIEDAKKMLDGFS